MNHDRRLGRPLPAPTAERPRPRRPPAGSRFAALAAVVGLVALAGASGCLDDLDLGGAGPPAGADAGPGTLTGPAPLCAATSPADRCRRAIADCIPSSCTCMGRIWSCTDDCGGGRICASGVDAGPVLGQGPGPTLDLDAAASVATPTCPAANPADECRRTADQCIPTSCSCTGGGWACARDCGGGRACAAAPLVALVGEQAFNEAANDGFTADRAASWQISDLRLAAAGRLTGTLTARYDGPTVDALQVRDVLFWQVRGQVKADAGSGRIGSTGFVVEPLSAMAAVQSGAGSGKPGEPVVFPLKGEFTAVQPAAPTHAPLEVAWTWVRVYRHVAGVSYHVLPGDGAGRETGDPGIPSPLPRALVDGEPERLSGSFGHYRPIAETAAKGGDFDYVGWVKAHVRW